MKKGSKHSEETRKKLSISHMGQHPVNPFKKGHIPWHKGTKGLYHQNLSDKQRHVLSERMKLFSKQVWTLEDREKAAERARGNTNRRGKTTSEETRKRISEANYRRFSIKTNHPRWVADRTKLTKKQERNDGAYSEWRRQVWLRDDFKCKIANPDCAGRIEAHHILPWARFENLRYEVSNGITLCHFHHPRKRVDEERLISVFQDLLVNETIL